MLPKAAMITEPSNPAPAAHKCARCGAEHASRNLLFKHLQTVAACGEAAGVAAGRSRAFVWVCVGHDPARDTGGAGGAEAALEAALRAELDAHAVVWAAPPADGAAAAGAIARVSCRWPRAADESARDVQCGVSELRPG